jgi:ring-1,2-phenylacetyl-CoA epoxidase subunit PaaC
VSTPLLDRASALPAEAVSPLVNLVVSLADNKHALGLRFAEWCSSGPTIEAGVAATAMAQDELGHARVLYGLLEDLPGAPRRSDREWAAEDARTVALVAGPFSSWPHAIVANVLLDRALTFVLQSAADSRYLPLQQRTRKLIEEERFHAVHGHGWLRQLAAEGPSLRTRLERIIHAGWADTLCWFGPGDGGALVPLVRAGILREAGEAVRQRFLRDVGPLCSEAGLAIPLEAAAGGWAIKEPLPWANWDETNRRVLVDDGRSSAQKSGHASPGAGPTDRGQPVAACPFCGSGNTELISLFGSTSLTSQYYCRECRSAFEQVKWGSLSRP